MGVGQISKTGIGRNYREYTAIAITASSTTTASISFGPWAGMVVHVPTGSSLTSLTFWAVINSVAVPLLDSSGVAVALTVTAGNAYDVPAAAFACSELRFVGNTTGTIDVQVKG